MRELSSAPQGHLFELLVRPGAERRGNQEFTAQLAHSPRSGAEGGTLRCQPRLAAGATQERTLLGVGCTPGFGKPGQAHGRWVYALKSPCATADSRAES